MIDFLSSLLASIAIDLPTLYFLNKWVKLNNRKKIDSLIQEIKQDPTISISQRNYAIKKMEELKGKV